MNYNFALDASIHKMKVQKRRIRNVACNRWTKEDKMLLLEIIKQDPTNFEKPTAQLYYNKMIANHQEFRVYGWKGIRDKMRNLRANYTKAIDWCTNNTVSGIDTEDAGPTIREYLLKLCEDFDTLSFIFGARNNIAPLFLHDREQSRGNPSLEVLPEDDVNTSTSEQLGETVEVEPDYLQESTHEAFDSTGNTRNIQFKEESTPKRLSSVKRQRNVFFNNSTSYLAEIQKIKTAYLREKLEFEKATEKKKLKMEQEKMATEERRLKLEEEMLALEKEKLREDSRLREMEIKNNYDINKIRLEKEMALKELELKYKYNKE